MSVAFDLRTNRRGGIQRYAFGITRAVLVRVPAETQIVLVSHPDERDEVQQLIPADKCNNVTVVAEPRRERFLRNGRKVRDALLKERVNYMHSFNYVVDTRLSLPFSFTVHDFLRMKYAVRSGTEEAFVTRWGLDERRRLSSLTSQMDRTDPPWVGTSLSREIWVLTEFLVRRARFVAVPSDATKREVRSAFGPSVPVAVIPGAVDAVFTPVGPVARSTKPFLLWVGANEPHKGIDRLLRAWKRARVEQVELHVVGRGLPHKMARAAGVVVFDDPDDRVLAGEYRGARALVVTSEYEGFCLPAAEASAVGTPVIGPPHAPLVENLGPALHPYAVNNDSALVHEMRRALLGGLPSVVRRLPAWSSAADALLDRIQAAADNS